MKQEVEETVGRIVGAHGNVNWTPLIYQFRNLSFEEIVPLYRLCDVALVTPLRDGMNLVAKEFIASRPDQTGVLILSEMAGASKEMGEALLINPFHLDDFARALEQALTMPVEEQVRRNQFLQDRLRRYDVNRWADEFVQALLATQKTEAARSARLLTGKVCRRVAQTLSLGGQPGFVPGLRRHAGAFRVVAAIGPARPGIVGTALAPGRPMRAMMS